jgi:REP element-mobilizing transposase RayT
MAGTYSQIYIQVVFAVQGRQNLLQKEWRQEVFKYIAGIIKNKGQKPIIVNGVEDHAHAFLGLKPSMALSDVVRDMKNNSSNFINDQAWIKGRFNWQEGYRYIFRAAPKHVTLSPSPVILPKGHTVLPGTCARGKCANGASAAFGPV